MIHVRGVIRRECHREVYRGGPEKEQFFSGPSFLYIGSGQHVSIDVR